MTRSRLLPMLVLAAAVAALAATVGFAVVLADDGGWESSPHGYSMMTASGASAPWYVEDAGKPVRTIAAARERAGRFADRLGLVPGEVMRFENNFYVLLDETDGRPATEVLVDPATGGVTLEYGPAMMWNTSYGMMSGTALDDVPGTMMGGGMMGGGMTDGMMGGARGMMDGASVQPGVITPSGSVSGTVSAVRARALANEWLRDRLPGREAVEPDAFPGYYTLHTMRDGRVEGMLSVNRRTGAIWYHWWHGRFLTMAE
jgi:hypothetical protein